LQDYAENTRPIITKFDGKVAHGLWKKQLDFMGNLNHVTVRLGQRDGYRYMGAEIEPQNTPHGWMCVIWNLF